MKKSNRKTTEVSYWESMTDNMVALLLLILLIMMLLMLYLVRIKNDDRIDDYLGNSFEHYYGDDDNNYNKLFDNPADKWQDNNNSGGGGGGGWVEEHPSDYPDPGAGIGYGEDRAAVFVRVLDGETDKTIKKEGITFELFDKDDSLQTLCTYYPNKISYKQYRTNENGVFYLPERIIPDEYHLNCLTEVPGYDTSEDTYFEIDKAYFWDDPFVVDVRLFPSKNVIELHLKDKNSGEPLSYGTFQIIAAENITTADGTVRYQMNSVVDTITVDENGVGTSEELYLGEYLIRQIDVINYYGKLEQDVGVKLKGRTADKRTQVVTVYQEKTTMELTAVDALYDTQIIPGAEFTLRTEDGAVLGSYTTNEQGSFVMTNLAKNTTYYIHQEKTAVKYQLQLEDIEFRVTGDGWINGVIHSSDKAYNRMLRIAIAVKDKLLRDFIADVNLALLDMDGNVVRTWTSIGAVQLIEGVDVGSYQLVVGGDRRKTDTILVKDIAEIQEYVLERWTLIDTLIVILICVAILGTIALLVWLIVRAYKKKKQKAAEEAPIEVPEEKTEDETKEASEELEELKEDNSEEAQSEETGEASDSESPDEGGNNDE